MLKGQKKISKKQLKQDALLTTVVKATTFYEENKKNIVILFGVIILLVGGSVVYSRISAENNEKAAAALGKALALYDNNQYQPAIDGETERGIVGLKSTVESYGSTDAGNLARFYLANAYLQLAKYDEALEHFEDFSAGEQLLEVSRLAGIAACCEARGEYLKAAEHYEKAATKFPDDVDAAANLNHAADNYALAGKKERAVELFKKIKKEYPTSQFARDADRYIARLSV